MDIWSLGLLANLATATAYLAISITLAYNLLATKQTRNNPLAVGTCLLYFTCGVGHGLHMQLLLDPVIGRQSETSMAAQSLYGQWPLAVWDVLTAAAGLWYWSLWRKFPDLVSGAAVYEDLRERQRRALQVNDDIVQGLVKAKLSLELNQAGGEEALSETLNASKHIISDLLGGERHLAGRLHRPSMTR
jgi:hypothetical protein